MVLKRLRISDCAARSVLNSIALIRFLNKLIQFSTKFKADSEANSELASREAEDTKKNIVTELKSLPQETIDVAPSATKVTAPAAGADDFFF